MLLILHLKVLKKAPHSYIAIYRKVLRRLGQSIIERFTMNHEFSDDSLDDDTLLNADDPAVVNTPYPPPVCEPPTSDSEPPTSGLQPSPSPTSSLPIGDLALQSPQERRKGQPPTGNWLSQEPADPPTTTHMSPRHLPPQASPSGTWRYSPPRREERGNLVWATGSTRSRLTLQPQPTLMREQQHDFWQTPLRNLVHG